MTEVWKDVPEFEGYYQVSSIGRVKSLARKVKIAPSLKSPRGHFRNIRERILRARKTAGSYPSLVLWKNHRMFNVNVHSLVSAAFLGPKPSGQETRHKDGNAQNPALSNLAYATPKQNAADKILHGTHLAGERAVSAKLTAAQVRDIRKSKQTQDQLASIFGVSQSQISRIKNRKQWAHL